MIRAGSLLGKLKAPEGCVSKQDLVIKLWPSAVGKRLAARARAVAMQGERLIVEVEDDTWQRQLRGLRLQILDKLEKIVGSPVARDIVFQVRVPRPMPQPAPLDWGLSSGSPAGPSAPTRDEADGIRDPGLRRIYKASRKKASA
jgi:hypothetical protein